MHVLRPKKKKKYTWTFDSRDPHNYILVLPDKRMMGEKHEKINRGFNTTDFLEQKVLWDGDRKRKTYRLRYLILLKIKIFAKTGHIT